jgi:predicted MFS family arabinose efflux permease
MGPVGRRWWVLVALSLGPAVSNSFARFAYALLLPAMRDDLGLTYAQAGALNTSNALGYLAGALLAVRYVSTFGNRRLFCIGMVVTTLAIVGYGLTADFVAQLVLRAIAGVTGALVFICGAVLASTLFPDRPDLSRTATAIYFGGAGAGILISGAGIPWLLTVWGEHAWREGWLAMGALSVAFSVLGVRGARQVTEPPRAGAGEAWPIRAFVPVLGSYLLFGIGYIVYMTFVVAWMVSRGGSALEVALTWGVLGAATMAAPLVWRVPRMHWRPPSLLAATLGVLCAGAALPLYGTSMTAMLASAFLFGSSMFSVPAAITEIIKTSLASRAWGPAVAFFTFVFSIGQAIGPIFSGWLADVSRSLQAGLVASVLLLLASCVVAWFQRDAASTPAAPARPGVDTRPAANGK